MKLNERWDGEEKMDLVGTFMHGTIIKMTPLEFVEIGTRVGMYKVIKEAWTNKDTPYSLVKKIVPRCVDISKTWNEFGIKIHKGLLFSIRVRDSGFGIYDITFIYLDRRTEITVHMYDGTVLEMDRMVRNGKGSNWEYIKVPFE